MKTLPNGQVIGPKTLLAPKKGCLLGKSHTSDFVGRTSEKMLLTKMLNY